MADNKAPTIQEIQEEENQHRQQPNSNSPRNEEISLHINNTEQNLHPENIYGYVPLPPLGFMNNYNNANHQIFRVSCSQPHERIRAKNYTKIRCSNITTEFINGVTFSYLTNPTNINNKFYYVLRDSNFNYSPSFTWHNGIFRTVTKEKFEEFFKDINEKSTKMEVRHIEHKANKERCCYDSLNIFFVILCIASFIIVPFGWYWYFPIFCLFLAVGILFIFLVAFSIPWSISNRHVHVHKVFTQYQLNTPEMETLINKWNNGYFIPNGIYITCPRNFKYIQFNVDPNCSMVIDDHELPRDSIPTNVDVQTQRTVYIQTNNNVN